MIVNPSLIGIVEFQSAGAVGLYTHSNFNTPGALGCLHSNRFTWFNIIE